jgi:hypothetical protein
VFGWQAHGLQGMAPKHSPDEESNVDARTCPANPNLCKTLNEVVGLCILRYFPNILGLFSITFEYTATNFQVPKHESTMNQMMSQSQSLRDRTP